MLNAVVSREKSARFVIKAIDEHGKAIGLAFKDGLAGVLREGEAPVNVEQFLQQLGRLLQRNVDALLATNAAHERELADDNEPRARRDELEARLRREIIGLRGIVEGVYGSVGLAALGLSQPAASGSDALKAYAATVIRKLRDPRETLKPTVSLVAFSFRPAEVAASLEPLVTDLGKALDDVAREKNEATTTMLARQEALANNDADFVRLAGLVEQFARAAGLTELAQRIRPSLGDPGVLKEDPTLDPKTDVAPQPKPEPRFVDPNMPNSDPFGGQ